METVISGVEDITQIQWVKMLRKSKNIKEYIRNQLKEYIDLFTGEPVEKGQ